MIRFQENIPDDCKKAMKELYHLKVNSLLAYDYEETFTDVWWLVLHEVDLYAEGEFGQGEHFEQNDPSAMNIRSAKSADSWLIRWRDLASKYSDPKYYSEYYFKCHVGHDFPNTTALHYYGQVI